MENSTASEGSVTRHPGIDSVLGEVVAKLIERYRKDAEASKAVEVDDSEMETLILAPGAGALRADDAAMTETVLLEPSSVQERRAFPASDETMTETIVSSPASMQQAAASPTSDEAMTETVLLPPASVTPRALPDSDEAMTETVLIQPTCNYDELSRSGAKNCSDNSIVETVLLAPGSKAPTPDPCQEGSRSVQQQAAELTGEGDLLETVMVAPRQSRPQVQRGAGPKRDDGSAR